MANTINLKGDGIRKEAVASSPIMPGHLVEFGGAQEMRVHSTAAAHARPAFALENDLIGRGIDDAYAAGEVVQYMVFPPGAEINALLSYGENVTKGAKLTSNGDGTLRLATGTNHVVAYAMDALNLSAADEDARLRVEVA